MKNKIFIRPTMEKGRIKKPKDEKARKRNTIINFRVTPEEKKRIEARIALTGLDRAEFFIESCLYQTVLVKGNVRTFREYDRLMKKLTEQINQDVKLEEMDPELLESMRMILEILDRLFGKVLESGKINHSESARNSQSQSVEKSQCASLLLPG